MHAIRGISFVAYRGDAVGVIGRNGSGKSTLLRAIAGLLPPEQGNVYTTGEASLLGVNAALLDDLTGERNVILGCLAMGMTKQEAKEKYQSIVDFSGVGEFIDLPMKTYSSGMGSRLRFAIAASKSHDVLLVDEALATGDAEFRVKSHARIEELRGEAGTVFLVAHNLEEVEQTCNRVIWMERGRIVTQGEDVIGIIDQYIEASGGTPVVRDPETGQRVGSNQAARRREPARPAQPDTAQPAAARGLGPSRATRGRGGDGQRPADGDPATEQRGEGSGIDAWPESAWSGTAAAAAGPRRPGRAGPLRARDGRRRQPQPQPHQRAAGRAALGRDLAVLGPGQLAHDVEAEADAAEPAPVAGLALDEPLEDPLPVGGRDADALVGHGDLDPVARPAGR